MKTQKEIISLLENKIPKKELINSLVNNGSKSNYILQIVLEESEINSKESRYIIYICESLLSSIENSPKKVLDVVLQALLNGSGSINSYYWRYYVAYKLRKMLENNYISKENYIILLKAAIKGFDTDTHLAEEWFEFYICPIYYYNKDNKQIIDEVYKVISDFNTDIAKNKKVLNELFKLLTDFIYRNKAVPEDYKEKLKEIYKEHLDYIKRG